MSRPSIAENYNSSANGTIVHANGKKVHVIEKYFYPITAGIEVNTYETYAVLAKMGWDITAHVSRDTLVDKNVLSDAETVSGIKIKRYRFLRPWGFFPKLDWQNADYVALHNFNVLPHLLVMIYSLYLKIIGKKHFKLFLTPHGGFNPEWSIFPLYIRLIKIPYHYLVGNLLVNTVVDGVRAVSEWEKEEMVKKGLKRDLIVVIDNGLDAEAFMNIEDKASYEIKEKAEKYGKYLIQIGRIYSIKNNETVIKALPKLPKDINYVLVGPIASRSYKAMLDGLIKELGLENRVFFAGVVKGIDKYYLIKRAQMMVHMALWESFCNVIHEGLSQGLVCIAAKNTAMPYLIKDGVNGYCLETRDHDALADKINYVLANMDSTEIKKIKQKSIELGLRNSWEEVAGRMYRFYNAVGKGEKYEDY